MAERYSGWFKRSGEVDPSPDALDAGKKLVGEIVRDRLNGGPPTQVRRKALADGSIVEARTVHGMPVVNIIRPRPTKTTKRIPALLDGFVVLPHQHATSFPPGRAEVVVPPPHPDNGLLPPWYSARDALPVDWPEGKKWVSYARPIEIPMLDRGLSYYGGVDWRNHDETLSVSWHGPDTRYFDDGTARKPYVYCKGRRILDLSELTADQVPIFTGINANSRQVVGAAIRDGKLLVLGIAYKTSLNTVHFLLRFGLSIKDPLPDYINAGVKIRQMPKLQARVDSVETLWSNERAAELEGGSDDYKHPWFFNQSATIAKRIVRSVDPLTVNVVYVEETLDCTDLEGIQYDRVSTPYYTEVTTEFTNMVIHAGRAAWTAYDENGIGTTVSPDATLGGWSTGDEPARLIVKELTHNRSGTAAQIPIAVDWRNDVPVYAYWRTGGFTSTLSMDSVPSHPTGYFYFDSYVDPANNSYVASAPTKYDYSMTFDLQRTNALVLPDEEISVVSSRVISNVSDVRQETETRVVHDSSYTSAPWTTTTVDEAYGYTVDDVDIERTLGIMFLDLRSGAVGTQVATRQVEHSGTYSISYSGMKTVRADNTVVSDSTANSSSGGLNRSVGIACTTRVSHSGVELHAQTASLTPPGAASNVPVSLNQIGIIRVFGDYLGGFLGYGTTVYTLNAMPSFVYGAEGTTPYGFTLMNPLLSPLASIRGDNGHVIGLNDAAVSWSTETESIVTSQHKQPANLASACNFWDAPQTWLSETPWRSDTSRVSYGTAATYKTSYAVSMPWPAGSIATPNYLNVVDGYPLQDAVGQDVTGFSPVWALPPTAYLK